MHHLFSYRFLMVLVLLTFCFSANVFAQQDAQKATASNDQIIRPFLSAKEVRGASPYIEIKNEPAPKLIVDSPLPDLLAEGVLWIQWRMENVHIVPVFGKGALNASPRVGHLEEEF